MDSNEPNQEQQYTKPALKKHATLKQVTFSSHQGAEAVSKQPSNPQKPARVESPFTQAALASELPAKVTTGK